MSLALAASILVAFLSLCGVFMFGKGGRIIGTHHFIVPVAIGVFLGVVFFELIPETLEMNEYYGPWAIIFGFLLFYLLSHLIKTYHHHHTHHADGCTEHGGTLLLIGDGIHNIADGIVIASAFMVSPTLGFGATLGIALHEIPQEIAEFGVLLKSGYSRRRAALLNLLSASSIILGVLLTFLFSKTFEGTLWLLTGFAAGNLLYIAATDLLPELKESHHGHFWQSFSLTVLGIALTLLLFGITHQ